MSKFCAALQRVRASPQRSATALCISREQVLNLARLADWLRALPADYERFEMSGYMEDVTRPHAHISRAKELPANECGTVACAVGHGPSAGIEPLSSERWESYALRCFAGQDPYVFTYLFGGEWTLYDNTAHGAAARIMSALDSDVPFAQRGLFPLTASTPLRYKEYLS